jgi:hypothetical protein
MTHAHGPTLAMLVSKKLRVSTPATGPMSLRSAQVPETPDSAVAVKDTLSDSC